MSRPLVYCGPVVTAAPDVALMSPPALGSRLVSSVTIVILVKPDSCDEDTTSSIESIERWAMTAAMARNSAFFASRTYACRRRLKIKIAVSRSKYDAYIYDLSLDTVAMCLRL
jgi:hypothetical protein